MFSVSKVIIPRVLDGSDSESIKEWISARIKIDMNSDYRGNNTQNISCVLNIEESPKSLEIFLKKASILKMFYAINN